MPQDPAPDHVAGRSAADIDALLPSGYFVRRGDIVRAFGLKRREIDAMIPEVFHPAPLPKLADGKKAVPRFVRSQVMGVARAWERKPAA